MKNFFTPSFFIICIVAAFLVTGCAASQHAGTTYVPKPAKTETNEGIWLSYWQDQFDAYSGNVIVPDASYPEAAKQAFQRAKLEWDRKVETAATNTSILLYGGGTVASLLLILAIAGAL